jgi:ribulose-phosphate 3-epimerase
MSRLATIKKLNSSSPIIAPSMLKCDFSNLKREIELLEAANAQVLHFDVMDGHFVPNLSYGPMVIEKLRSCTDLIFDAHLMISDPDQYLDEYLKAGCDCITVHYEANIDTEKILSRIRKADVVAGLAINPDTPVNKIEQFIPFCDLILVMSVNPGFGGQKFMPVALNKLEELNNLTDDNVILSVDGGIGTETIAKTSKAGAGFFVAGSSIFDTDCYTEAIKNLNSLATIS